MKIQTVAFGGAGKTSIPLTAKTMQGAGCSACHRLPEATRSHGSSVGNPTEFYPQASLLMQPVKVHVTPFSGSFRATLLTWGHVPGGVGAIRGVVIESLKVLTSRSLLWSRPLEVLVSPKKEVPGSKPLWRLDWMLASCFKFARGADLPPLH